MRRDFCNRFRPKAVTKNWFSKTARMQARPSFGFGFFRWFFHFCLFLACVRVGEAANPGPDESSILLRCHNINSLAQNQEVVSSYEDAQIFVGQEFRHTPSLSCSTGFVDCWSFAWGKPPPLQHATIPQRLGTKSFNRVDVRPGN